MEGVGELVSELVEDAPAVREELALAVMELVAVLLPVEVEDDEAVALRLPVPEVLLVDERVDVAVALVLLVDETDAVEERVAVSVGVPVTATCPNMAASRL